MSILGLSSEQGVQGIYVASDQRSSGEFRANGDSWFMVMTGSTLKERLKSFIKSEGIMKG